MINISFIDLIFKNPFRNRMRAFLSISGISVGIITIIVLGAITNGLIIGTENTLHAGGTDFRIMNYDQTDFMDEEWNQE